MKKVCSVLIACLLLSVGAVADGRDFQQAFAPVFAQSTHGVKLGKYKGQELKGKYSGMGVISLKSGGVYYGDVVEGVPEGYGVMVCPDGIKGCPDAAVYSGRFKKGLMDGNGTCYSADGAPLYKGRFAGGELGQRSEVADGIRFVVQDLSEGFRYVGEIRSSRPDGLGAIISGGGDVILGNFKEGQRDGIGVTIAANGEWQTENATGGQTAVLSSSTNYQNLAVQNKSIFKQALSEATNDIAVAIAGIADNVKDIASDGQAGDDEVSDDDDDAADVGKAGSKKEKGYTKKEYQAMYDENKKKAEKYIREYADILGAQKVKVKKGELSVMDESNFASGKKKCIVNYNRYVKQMRRIYNEALKHQYHLKKADFHDRILQDLQIEMFKPS
ncbi:MAG: hypothetical protein J1F13_07865 [Prevotellaceae bacterium]|nr:hypothetical protein [Prevotellaceae bacterium]